ncbi:uncharacterized protein [Miscanthus floridulus]|uniref:uncharacterized protein n=1 Tax=Miscanthus floridulus TaxID=154761 RepID=UPI0034574222
MNWFHKKKKAHELSIYLMNFHLHRVYPQSSPIPSVSRTRAGAGGGRKALAAASLAPCRAAPLRSALCSVPLAFAAPLFRVSSARLRRASRQAIRRLLCGAMAGCGVGRRRAVVGLRRLFHRAVASYCLISFCFGFVKFESQQSMLAAVEHAGAEFPKRPKKPAPLFNGVLCLDDA